MQWSGRRIGVQWVCGVTVMRGTVGMYENREDRVCGVRKEDRVQCVCAVTDESRREQVLGDNSSVTAANHLFTIPPPSPLLPSHSPGLDRGSPCRPKSS